MLASFDFVAGQSQRGRERKPKTMFGFGKAPKRATEKQECDEAGSSAKRGKVVKPPSPTTEAAMEDVSLLQGIIKANDVR